MQLCKSTCILMLMSQVVALTLACFPDQEGGVSANIACSQSSMQVTWDIPKIFESSPQQTTQGVECVNMLQFNCTYNGTVVADGVLTKDWCIQFRSNPPLNPTQTFTENVSLPVGAVCKLSGCYLWAIYKYDPFKFMGRTYYALPEKSCTVANSTDVSKTVMATATIRPDPLTTVHRLLPSPTDTTLMLPLTSITTQTDVTVTRTAIGRGPTTMQLVSAPSPALHTDNGASQLVLLFFVSLFSLLLLLSSFFIVVIVRVNLKANRRLQQTNRKYFDGLKDFDSFNPVSSSAIINTVSVPSLIETFGGNSCEIRDGYSNLAKEEEHAGSPESDISSVPYEVMNSVSQQQLAIPSMHLRSTMNASDDTSISFDLLSLQSLDHHTVTLSEVQVMERTEDYIRHNL